MCAIVQSCPCPGTVLWWQEMILNKTAAFDVGPNSQLSGLPPEILEDVAVEPGTRVENNMSRSAVKLRFSLGGSPLEAAAEADVKYTEGQRSRRSFQEVVLRLYCSYRLWMLYEYIVICNHIRSLWYSLVRSNTTFGHCPPRPFQLLCRVACLWPWRRSLVIMHLLLKYSSWKDSKRTLQHLEIIGRGVCLGLLGTPEP